MATVNEPSIYSRELSYEERSRLRKERRQTQKLNLRRSASPVRSVPFRTQSPTIPASHSPTMGFVSEYAYVYTKSSSRGSSSSPSHTRTKRSSSPSDGLLTPNGACASDLSFARSISVPERGSRSPSANDVNQSENGFAGVGNGPSMNGASNVFVSSSVDASDGQSQEDPLASAFSSWGDIGVQFSIHSPKSPLSSGITATSVSPDPKLARHGNPGLSTEGPPRAQKECLPPAASAPNLKLSPNTAVAIQPPLPTHYECQTSSRLDRCALNNIKTTVFREDLYDSCSQDVNVFAFQGEHETSQVTPSTCQNDRLPSRGRDQTNDDHEEKELISSSRELKSKRSEVLVVPSSTQKPAAADQEDVSRQKPKNQKKAETEHKSGKKEGRRFSGLFGGRSRTEKEPSPPKQLKSDKSDDVDKLSTSYEGTSESYSSVQNNCTKPARPETVISPESSSDGSTSRSPATSRTKKSLFRLKPSVKKGSRAEEDVVGKTGWTYRPQLTPDTANRGLYPARSEMSLTTIGEGKPSEPPEHSMASFGRTHSLEQLDVPSHSDSHQLFTMTEEIVSPPVTVFHSNLDLFDGSGCDEEKGSENRNNILPSPFSAGSVSLGIDDDIFSTPSPSPQPSSSTSSVVLEVRSEPLLPAAQAWKPQESVLVRVTEAPESSNGGNDDKAREKHLDQEGDTLLPGSISEPVISASKASQGEPQNSTDGNQISEDQTAMDSLGSLPETTPFSRQSKARKPVVRKPSFSGNSPRSSLSRHGKRSQSFSPHDASKASPIERTRPGSSTHSESGRISISPSASPSGTPVFTRAKFGSGRGSPSSGRGTPSMGKRTPDSGKGTPVFSRFGSGRGSGRSSGRTIGTSPQMSPAARRKSPSFMATGSPVTARKKSSVASSSPGAARKKPPAYVAPSASPVAARKKTSTVAASGSSPVVSRKKPPSGVGVASSPIAPRKKVSTHAGDSASPMTSPKHISSVKSSPPTDKKSSSGQSGLQHSVNVKTSSPQGTPAASPRSSFGASGAKSQAKAPLPTKTSPQTTRKPATYVAKIPMRTTNVKVNITSTSTAKPGVVASSSSAPAVKDTAPKNDTPRPLKKVTPSSTLGGDAHTKTSTSEQPRKTSRPTNIVIPAHNETAAKHAELSLSPPQSASSGSSLTTPGGRKRRIGVSASSSPLVGERAFFSSVESSLGSVSSSPKEKSSNAVEGRSSAMDIDVSDIFGSALPSSTSPKDKERATSLPTDGADKGKLQGGRVAGRHSTASEAVRKTSATSASLSVGGPTSPRRLSTPANAPTKAPIYVYSGASKRAKASLAGDSAKSREPTTFKYKGTENLQDLKRKSSGSTKPSTADGKKTTKSTRASVPTKGSQSSSNLSGDNKENGKSQRSSSPLPPTMSVLGPISDILHGAYSLSQPLDLGTEDHTLMATKPEVPVWSSSSQSQISDEPLAGENDKLTYAYRSALLRGSVKGGSHEKSPPVSRVASGKSLTGLRGEGRGTLGRTSSNRKVSTLPRKSVVSTSAPRLSGLDTKASMRKKTGAGVHKPGHEGGGASEKGKSGLGSMRRSRSSSMVSTNSTGVRKPSSATLVGKSRSSIVRASGRKSQVKKALESQPPTGPSMVFEDGHRGLGLSSDESESADSRPNSPTGKRAAGKPPTGLVSSSSSSSSIRKSSRGVSKSSTTSALTTSMKADSTLSRGKGNIRKSFSSKLSTDKPPSGAHGTARKITSKSKSTAEVQMRASVRFSRTSSSGTIRKISTAAGGSPSHVPLGKRPTPTPSTPMVTQGSPVHRSLKRGSSAEREEAFSAFDHISLLASDTIETPTSDHRRAVRPKMRQKPSSSHLQMLKDRKDISSELEDIRLARENSPRKLDPNSYSTYMGKKVLDKTALAGLAAKLNFDTVKLRKTGIIEDMMTDDQAQVGGSNGKSAASPSVLNYGVELTKHPVILIQIKGRKLVQTRLVEPVAASINSGDAYILVTDRELFQWLGKGANVIEKARSSDIVSRIHQRKELGCHVTGFVKLDDGDASSSRKENVFWELLDGRTKIKDAHSVPSDEVYEKAVTMATKVYSYQGDDENGQFVIIHEDKAQILKIALLDTKKIMLFDFYSEVYVWIGKHSPFPQRKPATLKARKMFDMGCHPPVFPQPSSPAHKTSLKSSGRFRRSVTGRISLRHGALNASTRRKSKEHRHTVKTGELHKRPEWALFGKVTEGAETILFREKFADWPEPGRIIKMKGHESSGAVIKPLPSPELQPADMDLMLKPRPKFEGMRLEGENVHRGKGNYKVSRSTFACNRVYTKELTKWHVKEFDNVIIPPKDHGIFYSEEGYVFRWAYIITVVRELEGLTPGQGMFAKDRQHQKRLKQEKESKENKQEGSDSSADEKKKKKKSAEDEVNTSSEEEENSDDECQRILESGGRDRAAFFFWQGEYASVNEKGAAAVMTVELDKERCPQIRVIQGKEHPTFLQLFRGGMIVLCGKSDTTSLHHSEKGYRLYTTRGQIRSEAVLLEIDTHNKPLSYYLRSRNCYVLHHMLTKTVFLWIGCQASESVRNVASFAVKKLRRRLTSAGSVNFVRVQEGFESKELLSILGGRDHYQCLLNSVPFPKFSPRLYELSSSTGWFVPSEVLNTMFDNSVEDVDPFPFLQEDIYHSEQPTFFLLDAYHEVYLWLGWWPQQKNKLLREKNALTGTAHTRWIRDKKLALQTAFNYAEACKRTPTPGVFVVHAGSEHPHFTNMFPYWNESKDVQELNCNGTATVPTRVDAKSELAKYNRSQFTLEELRMRPPPEGVDSSRLETYLSDADFQNIFRMTRDEFQVLLSWKQTDLKKRVGLF